MVKLIASDLDGTLLQNGLTEVSDRAIDLIKKLHEYGVIFAPASGRQLSGLRRLFSPVADNLVYICLNGAYVKYRNEVIYKEAMNREKCIELLKSIKERKECGFLLYTEEVSYTMADNDIYIESVKDDIKNDYICINDFDEIKGDILKISIYHKGETEILKDYLSEKFDGEFKVTVSGKHFIDIVSKDVNKGKSLQKVKERFNIETDFAMCFGDSFNDLEMFDVVYFSYAMTHSDSEIRKKARYLTGNVEDILYDVFKMLELG